MTVKDIKEKLASMPDNAEVVFDSCSFTEEEGINMANNLCVFKVKDCLIDDDEFIKFSPADEMIDEMDDSIENDILDDIA